MSSTEIDFKYLTENSVDVICRVGTDHILHYLSPSCVMLFGYTREEMEGRTSDCFVLAEDLQKVEAAIARAFLPGVQHESETVRMMRKDGSLVWTEVNGRIIRDAITQEVIEFVLVMRDVNERKHLEQRLEALALTDGLTGIGNRRAFDEELACEWKRTLREGSQMSLLLLDIDHFKRFNDTNGHQVGDDCLRAVAQAAVSAVRQTDTVARYGGEEIAIILPRVDALGAMETAEKVRLAIEALRMTHDGNPEGGGWVSASIGAATALARLGGTTRMPESLLQAADTALYKAKRGGRNRVEAGLLIAPQEACSAGGRG